MTNNTASSIFGKKLMIMEDINLRELCDGNFYHVCTNGLEQVTLLRDDEDYRTAWNYLALSVWRTGVQVVAFTLMSNHIHEILVCRDTDEAVRTIKLFKKQLSQYLKRRYGLSKILHETDDCISKIDTVQYLKNCIAYIHRNAVSARICAKPEEYRWSSYSCFFSSNRKQETSAPVSNMGFTKKRTMLKTGMDLSDCRLRINNDGQITLDSFVRIDIVERAYMHSGKSFLYYLGCCNDTKMEYELACKPLMHISDHDLYETITTYSAKRFCGRNLSELTTADKCSMLKHLFFNNKTSIPQLSRVLGLPRTLVHKLLSK